MIKKIGYIIILSLLPFIGISQETQDSVKGNTQIPGEIIDQVIAVVGGNIILHSDIESQYQQYLFKGYTEKSGLRCLLIEELMFQKLLLDQAEVDSVQVSPSQVESELQRRMNYFIQLYGGKDNLEKELGKTVLEWNEELYMPTKEQLLVQQVQSGITSAVLITPSEIRKYFNNLAKDSIPAINAQYQISQIVIKPKIRETEKQKSIDKLNELRERIANGDRFDVLARLYSDDPGSASQGGDLGFTSRGTLYPEFEAVAYSLKKGQVSEVFKTEAGYHIIKMIERRGDLINVKHILIIPEIKTEDILKAKKDLDNIKSLIEMDSISFEKAAQMHSDDPTAKNGGIVINPVSGNATFEANQIDASLHYVVKNLNKGEISSPVPMLTSEGQKAYRIIFLVDNIDAHQANLKDDYSYIKNIALLDKQDQALNDWLDDKVTKTYIKINEDFKDCDFNYNWNFQ